LRKLDSVVRGDFTLVDCGRWRFPEDDEDDELCSKPEFEPEEEEEEEEDDPSRSKEGIGMRCRCPGEPSVGVVWLDVEAVALSHLWAPGVPGVPGWGGVWYMDKLAGVKLRWCLMRGVADWPSGGGGSDEVELLILPFMSPLLQRVV